MKRDVVKEKAGYAKYSEMVGVTFGKQNGRGNVVEYMHIRYVGSGAGHRGDTWMDVSVFKPKFAYEFRENNLSITRVRLNNVNEIREALKGKVLVSYNSLRDMIEKSISWVDEMGRSEAVHVY